MQSSGSFVIQPYRRRYLEDYGKRMSKDQLGDIFDDNVAAALSDQEYYIPENPRSIYRVEKLYEALNKYAPANAPYVAFSDDVTYGIRLAYACFARGKRDYLKMGEFTPEFIRKITSNLQASAGLTAWGQTKADAITRAYERGIQTLQRVKFPEPCVAFKRTQFDDKTRLVWGYPYSMTAIEGLIARPLIDTFKEGVTPMAFATRAVVLGSKLRVSSYHNKFAYAIDVKSFDSSASSKLIHVAFNILRTWFNPSDVDPTTGCYVMKVFDLVEDYFIHTPIVMPDLNIYKGKKHGVPSGSYFTQIVDSIINTIYVGTIGHHFNMFVSREDINVLGDDVLFWSNTNVRPEAIASFATKTFGCFFNPKKTHKYLYNQSVQYLGRIWSNGQPDASQEDILVRMVHAERFRRYSKNPQERKREVNLLIASYVTTYRSAYRIWLESYGDVNRTYNSLIELARLGETDSVDPDHISGLQRFRMKYVDTEHRGGDPLALQYWK